jgi:hypothetical protein
MKKPGHIPAFLWIFLLLRIAAFLISMVFNGKPRSGNFMQLLSIKRPDIKKAERNIWWLAFFDDWLTFNSRNVEAYWHKFSASVVASPTDQRF